MARYVTRELKYYNTILKGSPVVLDKTRLLYDTETLDLIFQISLKNISENNIKFISFKANLYDKSKELIKKNEKIVIKERIHKLDKFSTNEPIIINDRDVYFVSLIVESVEFEDGEKWTNKTDNNGTEIKRPKEIVNYEFVSAAKEKKLPVTLNNYPIFTDDYYICSCGKINDDNTNFCVGCGISCKELVEIFDEENIKTLVEEHRELVEKERKKKEEETKKRRDDLKKETVKFTKFFLLLILIVVVLFIGYQVINNIVCYNKGMEYYENKEYEKSIEVLKKIDTKKSKSLLSDVYYDYGIYLKENNQCEDAMPYFELTTNKVDNSIIDECYVALGDDSLMDGEYLEAIDYYDLINGNFSREEKLFYAYYEYGKYLYDEEKYDDAVSYFNKCDGYKDCSDLLNQSKVAYIKDNFDIKDKTTERYINDLIDDNYAGSNELYDELTKWNVRIYANSSKYSESDMSSISGWGSIYFHFELSGGKKDEKINISYRIKYPDGTTGRLEKFDESFTDGESGYVYWDYGDYDGGRGNLTIIIYNDSTSKEIGRHTVKVT